MIRLTELENRFGISIRSQMKSGIAIGGSRLERVKQRTVIRDMEGVVELGFRGQLVSDHQGAQSLPRDTVLVRLECTKGNGRPACSL